MAFWELAKAQVWLNSYLGINQTGGGTQIGASGGKLGFYGATPAAQPSGTTDILTGLINLGLRASGANPPLNMGTGALTCGSAAISGTAQSVLGAAMNPADATADFGWTPSAAGKKFVFNTTSTQPLVVRQVGGVVGTNESAIYHDGTSLQITVPSTGAGRILVPIGSAAQPSIAFGGGAAGDNITGIFRFAQQYIGFSTNGNEAMLLDSSQNVRVTGQLSFGGSGANDIGFARVTSNVVRVTAGTGGGNGWLQNSAGEGALDANFTRSNATLTATNLSYTVIAGRSYRIEGYLIVSNSTATEGAKFDFAGGTATATTFDLALDNLGTFVAGTTVSAALSTVLNYMTVTGTNRILVRGFLKVNAGGTLILRAAEDTTAVGTMTLAAGSWLALSDTVAL